MLRSEVVLLGAHVLFLALDFMTDPLFVETLERLFFLLA